MLEQIQNSAPVAPQVVNSQSLDKSGKRIWKDEDLVSSYAASADAQNQLNMAKYNNDYNYWLWQQQTAYNSPEQQVARLKAAGLNPNFNSIEGAGNASSPAPSSGKLQTNFLGAYQASISARAQRLNEINSVVSAFNDLVKNVGQGFDIVRSYSQTPSSISSYRDGLRDLLLWNRNKAGHEASIKAVQDRIISLIATGDNSLYGDNPMENPLVKGHLGTLGAQGLAGQIAQQKLDNLVKDGALKDVITGLRKFERDELQPLEKQQLEESINNLMSRTQFIDTQNEFYSRIKVGGLLLPFAAMLLKNFL